MITAPSYKELRNKIMQYHDKRNHNPVRFPPLTPPRIARASAIIECKCNPRCKTCLGFQPLNDYTT